MKRHDNLRNQYSRYLRKSYKAKIRSVNSVWAFIFLLAGGSLGILFCAFILEDGFESVILSAIGFASLSLAVIGLVLLVKY